MLDEKLTAAGGALVVRHNGGDLAINDKVDEKRFPAQRSYSIEVIIEFTQAALEGGGLGKMAEMAGNTEIVGVGEIRTG